jgi:hypothetical protein
MIAAGCSGVHKTMDDDEAKPEPAVTISGQPAAIADAATAILQAEKLADVRQDATNLDAQVEGRMANGQQLKVAIERLTDTSSSVRVSVGGFEDNKTIAPYIIERIKSKVSR